MSWSPSIGVPEVHAGQRARGLQGTTDAVTPCGACRQVIAEFADEACTITFPRDGELTTFSLDEILPERFRL